MQLIMALLSVISKVKKKKQAIWLKNGTFVMSEKKQKKIAESGLSLEEYYGFEGGDYVD